MTIPIHIDSNSAEGTVSGLVVDDPNGVAFWMVPAFEVCETRWGGDTLGRFAELDDLSKEERP